MSTALNTYYGPSLCLCQLMSPSDAPKKAMVLMSMTARKPRLQAFSGIPHLPRSVRPFKVKFKRPTSCPGPLPAAGLPTGTTANQSPGSPRPTCHFLALDLEQTTSLDLFLPAKEMMKHQTTEDGGERSVKCRPLRPCNQSLAQRALNRSRLPLLILFHMLSYWFLIVLTL